MLMSQLWPSNVLSIPDFKGGELGLLANLKGVFIQKFKIPINYLCKFLDILGIH